MPHLQDDIRALSIRLRDISARADALLPDVEDVIISAPRERDAVMRAQEMLQERRKRDRQFEGLDLFGEPAWDILLDLFVRMASRQHVSVSSACVAAAVPPTTGLRHVKRLQDLNLIEDYSDPFDKRRRFLRLSASGMELMKRTLA